MSGHPVHKVKNNCDIVSVTAVEQLFTGISYKNIKILMPYAATPS
jgi:hypothetical protein